jgi:hypothetical protein
MSLIIKSGSGSELWKIDETSLAGRTSLYDAQGNQIPIINKTTLSATQKALLGMGSDGKLGRFNRVDKYGNSGVLKSALKWYDPVEGSAVNTLVWTQSLTTQTMTQAIQSILFNASAITTVTTGSMLNSTMQFFKKPRIPLLVRFTKVRFGHFNGAVMEMGFGLPSSATANAPVPNGNFMRVDVDGAIYLVNSYNSIETLSPALTAPNSTDFYTVEVMVMDDSSSLRVFDSSGVPIIDTTLSFDLLNQGTWSVSHLPVFVRTYNNTAPASAPSLRISTTAVHELDIDDTEPFTHKMTSLGKHLWNNPFTAFNQLANYTNNTAPTTRTPSNTVAGETTLGGQISWNNAGTSFGASDTLDLILFGYQNVSPYQMIITDLMVDTLNLGAVVGATEYTIQYFIAVNGTAISLATATYTRQTLGFQSIVTGSAVGTRFQPRISENFASPIVVEAGRFIVLGARVISGTATLAQVIRTLASFKGYFK